MKIVYAGAQTDIRKRYLASKDDFLLLLHDRWDDYSYKTRFPTLCRVGGEIIELGAVKILFAGEKSSHSFLVKKRENGWDGKFPFKDADYISVTETTTFYEQLLEVLPEEGALKVAQKLRDASYLAHVAQDDKALALINTEGFRDSLQRERSLQNSFAEGWRVLNGQALDVANLSFTFRNPTDGLSTLRMNFASKSLLPHDVNVIIGPNGVGKSSLLRQMINGDLPTML